MESNYHYLSVGTFEVFMQSVDYEKNCIYFFLIIRYFLASILIPKRIEKTLGKLVTFEA